MAQNRSLLFAGLMLFGVIGCSNPVAEPGGGTSGGGTTGGTTGGGATTGAGGTGGGTTGGDAGPMCPSNCPVIHSSCDQATTTTGTCICDPGYSPCGNSCADLASDQANCGFCGNACDASNGYTCLNNTCTCGVGGLFGLCPGTDGGPDVCSNPTVDPHNCGFCGNDCGALICSNSSCTCNAPLYQCTATDGTPYCADISHDIDNCGRCGQLCGFPTESHDVRAATWQCVSSTGGPGVCACKTGFFMCQAPGMPLDCVDLATDSFNCGSCNYVCDGGTCDNSHCSAICQGIGKPCFMDTDCCVPLRCDQNVNQCKV